MKTKSFLLAVAFATMAFTFSCSSDDSGGDSGGSSPGSGGGGGYTGPYGSVTHGGQTYKTVVIGTQTWMAENLNYDVPNNDDTDDICYGNNSANCAKYGRLYNWSTANIACPSGWHLPSQAEWEVMVAYIGGESAGRRLRARSGWNEDGNGVDDYGFSALPGGFGKVNQSGSNLVLGGFGRVGDFGNWWSSSTDGSGSCCAHSITLGRYNGQVQHSSSDLKIDLKSVRCVKNEGGSL